jgi:hypothetical protein
MAIAQCGGDWCFCDDDKVSFCDISKELSTKKCMTQVCMLWYENDEDQHPDERRSKRVKRNGPIVAHASARRVESDDSEDTDLSLVDSDDSDFSVHEHGQQLGHTKEARGEQLTDVQVEIQLDDQIETEEAAQELESRFRQKITVDDSMSSQRSSFIAKHEHAILKLREQFRERPTLPHGVCKENLESGSTGIATLPKKHCAFQRCAWHGDTDAELLEHLANVHVSAFENLDWDSSLAYHTVETIEPRKKRIFAMYTAAIRAAEQSMVPCVGDLIDRRCRNSFLEMMNDENVYAPICLVCARVLPFEKYDTACEIQYRSLWEKGLFLGMCRADAEACMGFVNFLNEHSTPNLHGKKIAGGTGVNLKNNMQQFDGWTLQVPFEPQLQVLCCPEDVRCDGAHPPGVHMCERCEAPVCNDCYYQLYKRHKLPRYGICNDLWIGQIDEYIYKNKVTYVELLCASPIHPVVLCYQMHHQQSNVSQTLEQPVHFAESTTRAWGNITGFLLKWEDIVNQLRDIECAKLPRTDEELLQVINVIIYTQRKVTIFMLHSACYLLFAYPITLYSDTQGR